MNSIKEFLSLAELLVKELIEQINTDNINFKKVEEKSLNLSIDLVIFDFRKWPVIVKNL